MTTLYLGFDHAMKLFTVEEANALLPQLRNLLINLDALKGKLLLMAPDAQAASAKAVEGGGTPRGIEYASAVAGFLEITQEILGLGIEIKDFERGLCDFPHLRDGKVVYLCWQRHESRVEWWHDVEAGFAGRQPL
jgi:hypothetical protein